jgi:hypothetical protein
MMFLKCLQCYWTFKFLTGYHIKTAVETTLLHNLRISCSWKVNFFGNFNSFYSFISAPGCNSHWQSKRTFNANSMQVLTLIWINHLCCHFKIRHNVHSTCSCVQELRTIIFFFCGCFANELNICLIPGSLPLYTFGMWHCKWKFPCGFLIL